MNKLVSILIATYNPNKHFFSIALKSVLRQSYLNIEVIIIDDGSEEDICDFIKSFADPRIKVFRNDINLGLPRSLNKGIELCNGDYIARMDDDDIMHINRIENQMFYLEENIKYKGCFSNINIINNEGTYQYTKINKVKPENFLKELLKNGNFLCHPTLLIEKKVLVEVGGYNHMLFYAQDYDLYIRILKKFKLGLVDRPLLDYRVNNDSRSLSKVSLQSILMYYPCLIYYCENKTLKNKLVFIFRTAKFAIYHLFIFEKKWNSNKRF